MQLLHLIFGISTGYFVASYIESFLHEHVSDAPTRRVNFWRKYPSLLKPLINTHYSHHTIHHVKTWQRDHVTQFRSDSERQKLDKVLHARGKHGTMIIEGLYAAKLHSLGMIVFTTPLLLACILLFIFTPVLFAVGACTTIFLPTLFSNFIHPYLHMPFDRGQKEAPRVVAWLLGTRYFKAMYVNHFIHHRYGGTSNYNLVLGADWLRGKTRIVTEKDVHIMRDVGLPWKHMPPTSKKCTKYKG